LTRIAANPNSKIFQSCQDRYSSIYFLHITFHKVTIGNNNPLFVFFSIRNNKCFQERLIVKSTIYICTEMPHFITCGHLMEELPPPILPSCRAHNAKSPSMMGLSYMQTNCQPPMLSALCCCVNQSRCDSHSGTDLARHLHGNEITNRKPNRSSHQHMTYELFAPRINSTKLTLAERDKLAWSGLPACLE
jgi:hypothetical protein